MRKPISLGVMCQSLIRIGSANAKDSALNASKNVALPMITRAFVCHQENGTFSMREISAAALTASYAFALAAFDRLVSPTFVIPIPHLSRTRRLRQSSRELGPTRGMQSGECLRNAASGSGRFVFAVNHPLDARNRKSNIHPTRKTLFHASLVISNFRPRSYMLFTYGSAGVSGTFQA